MMPWASPKKVVVPKNHRLIGHLVDSKEPIFAPPGHSLLLSANGGGKTSRGCMIWIFSLLTSSPDAAGLVLDSKQGELASQLIPLLVRMGRRVALIDDMGVLPQFAEHRVQLNPFGAVVEAFKRDPRDVGLVAETIMNVLIEDPPTGIDQNQHFREVPREFNEMGLHVLLARNPAYATPGGVAAIINDPEMFKTLAEIEAEEGGPALQSLARNVIEMSKHDNFGTHLSEARRSLKLFSPGTRLSDVGKDAALTHADLIRDGYIIFLVGRQENINRLGAYYALNIQSFCNALYEGAGQLWAVCDEFTNTPLKTLVESLTTLRAFGPSEIHMVAQSRSEIIRRFGEHECATIEENAITKLYFGFSSIEEARRHSEAIGDEHAVAEAISGNANGLNTQTNLSLIKQKHLSAAELMSLPPGRALGHIKGVGYFLFDTYCQNEIDPFCDWIAVNPLEGGRLTPDPKLTLATPKGA